MRLAQPNGKMQLRSTSREKIIRVQLLNLININKINFEICEGKYNEQKGVRMF